MKKKSSTTSLAVLTGVILLAMTGLIAKNSYDSTKKNALEEMSLIVDERTRVIDEFVDNAENTLDIYSSSDQITDLLNDQDNKKLADEAQKFTEDYSKSIQYLDGIYVSDFNTHVRAHSTSSLVGVVTRSDPETLKALQTLLLNAGDEVYNAGILMSPSTYIQSLIMYKAVCNENGEPAGITGLSLHIDKLTENNDPVITGVKSTSYTMINVNDLKYIFGNSSELAGKSVENEQILSLCNALSKSNSPEKGTLEYKDDSEKYMSSYSYMPEYGWLLMLDAKV